MQLTSANAQVSVGRLGIITEVELDIVQQQNLTRVGHRLPFSEFETMIAELQDAYNGAVNGSSGLTLADVLDPWEATQAGSGSVCVVRSAWRSAPDCPGCCA